MEQHGAIAGTASALMGTLQMICGAVAMGIVGLFANGQPLPMVVGMASGALTALALTWVTLRVDLSPHAPPLRGSLPPEGAGPALGRPGDRPT